MLRGDKGAGALPVEKFGDDEGVGEDVVKGTAEPPQDGLALASLRHAQFNFDALQALEIRSLTRSRAE